jgi:hypothetical protein
MGSLYPGLCNRREDQEIEQRWTQLHVQPMAGREAAWTKIGDVGNGLRVGGRAGSATQGEERGTWPEKRVSLC